MIRFRWVYWRSRPFFVSSLCVDSASHREKFMNGFCQVGWLALRSLLSLSIASDLLRWLTSSHKLFSHVLFDLVYITLQTIYHLILFCKLTSRILNLSFILFDFGLELYFFSVKLFLHIIDLVMDLFDMKFQLLFQFNMVSDFCLISNELCLVFFRYRFLTSSYCADLAVCHRPVSLTFDSITLSNLHHDFYWWPDIVDDC